MNANARLIAAAPDLLGALQDLVSLDEIGKAHDIMMQEDPDQGEHGPDNCAVCAARAAIAKTEGTHHA